MSATSRADFETSSAANVRFSVRCEKLGHGEELFLVPDSDQCVQKAVPLYTTSSTHPWYHTIKPLTLTLPPRSIFDDKSDAEAEKNKKFVYRYAIHRAGVFHRWENPSDGPEDIAMSEGGGEGKEDSSGSSSAAAPPHEIPLHHMDNQESYQTSDVLGVTKGLSAVEHLQTHSHENDTRADTMHSRSNSRTSIKSGGSGNNLARVAHSPAPRRGKAVGFAAMPPPYQPPNKAGSPKAPSVHLNSQDGLIVVSAFLPVILHRSDDPDPVWTADWDYEVLLSMQTHLRVTRVGIVKWRGWHGNTGDGGSPEAGVPRSERGLVEECLRPFNCVPVWIDPVLFGKMYNGFCKGVLWPVFHNITSVYSSKPEDNDIFLGRQDASQDAQYSEVNLDDVEQGPIHGGRGREAELWSAYNTVNKKFAEGVVQCYHDNDMIWVHGFHLLILPSYLTRRISMAKVGIFLHTPFPSSEIFRTLWCREDLLRGMLNADQVGFHLFEYARHFLTACRRLLGLDYGMIPDASGGHTLAIDTNGRHVVITSIHAGVEPPVLNQVLAHGTTIETATSIRNRFQGKHILCGIDRLEPLKGIPLKLLGLERFLHRCPEWVGKVVLIQVGISAFECGEDYHRTLEEVNALVEKINARWPDTVQFQECRESEMRLQQRMALLRASDTCVITSIRDGLNLLPLEFTVAHLDASTTEGRSDKRFLRRRGICILSEFSSCTRVMRGALHVNPWKISEIAKAFHVAVNIGEEERLMRIKTAKEFVSRVTTQRWALAVMLDLKGVHKNQSAVQYSGAGLGLGFRLVGMDNNFVSLDTGVVAKAYKNSRSRLILLDYGGTIVHNENIDSLVRFRIIKGRKKVSRPTDKMVAALKSLCEDKKNTVFVVSGKERHSLTETLGEIPNLGFAAEHGMFISWPTSKTSSKRTWETLVRETDRSWRKRATNLMELYTSRTHGSYIEETEMKVLWQYRDADTEFGFQQAKELEDHLSKDLRRFPVDILHGGKEEGGYVEVRPKGVNKGVLAMRVLESRPLGKEGVDFALVLGDDHCDEPMLSVMRQIGRRAESARRAQHGEDPLTEMPATIQLVDVSSCDSFISPELKTFTCTVGKKPSAAASYLHDVDEVQELMDSLVKVGMRENQFYSAVDLRSLSDPRLAPLNPIELTNNGFVAGSMIQSMSLNRVNRMEPEAHSQSLTDYIDHLGPIEDKGSDEDDGFFF